MAEITFTDGMMRVHFRKFGLDDYATFLRAKRIPEAVTEFVPEDETYILKAPQRFAPMLGVEVPGSCAQALPLADFLFDDQKAITHLALDAKRFAVWSDCGFGKTLIALEFSRHVVHQTKGRVLIITLNDLVSQWMDEARNFYGDTLPLHRIGTRKELRQWCAHGSPESPAGIGITNYEKMNPDKGLVENQLVDEMRCLAGVVLDESSRLAMGGGKQKWAIIKSSRGVEYKLSCTATPAPNDTMEFASQASFLEKMRSDGEIIWTYFVRDQKTHRWTVKPHARSAFFEFMSAWSICVREPKKYGWRLDQPEVPEPTVHVHPIEPTPEQLEMVRRLSVDGNGQGSLFAEKEINTVQRAKYSQVAKGFIYRKSESARVIDLVPSHKPEFVARLVQAEREAGLQVLVWTVFNAETKILGELLGKAIPGEFAIITGDTKEAERIEILERFRKGTLPVLVSRANMLGYGMNFQCCGSMIFSGWTDSYTAYYQAVRRAYRFGQTRSVRVHLPVIPDLEQEMLDNIFRKDNRHEREAEEMEANYVRAVKALYGGRVA